MTYQFQNLIRITLIFVFFLVPLASKSAFTNLEYIWALRKNYPALIPTWHTILPNQYRNSDIDHNWIYNLDGTNSSVKITAINGENFFIGSVCKPHDCGGNNLVFLISINSPKAYGMIISNFFQAGEFFGTDSQNARSLLKYYYEVYEDGNYDFVNDPFIKKIPENILDPKISNLPTTQNVPQLNNQDTACARFPNLC